jgi:hypothetical protein
LNFLLDFFINFSQVSVLDKLNLWSEFRGVLNYDMYQNGVNTSNSLDAFFGGVSFAGPWGAAIGGTYFVGNLLTVGITGKTIGQHVDDNFYVVPVGLPNTPFILIPKN